MLYYTLYIVELCTYLQYAKNLKFEEKPDYTFLRRMVQDLIFLHDDYDCIYDWTTFVPQVYIYIYIYIYRKHSHQKQHHPQILTSM